MATKNPLDRRSLRRMKSVLKQLEELEENLLLIEERKAETVLSSDISLQLVKDERATKEKIEKLRSEVAGFVAKSGITEEELRAKVAEVPEDDNGNAKPAPNLWPLFSGGIVVMFLVLLTVLWATGSGPFAARGTPVAEQGIPMPVAEPLAAALDPTMTPTPTASPTPEMSPREAALATIIATGLPTVAPSLATTVTLLAMPVCADAMKDVADFLADSVKDYEPVITVLVDDGPEGLPEDEAEQRKAVRTLGADKGADLLVWCTGDGDGRLFHLETVTQRAAPEVYEPPTISIPLLPVERLRWAIYGVVVYLRRDYVNAESILQTATRITSGDEVGSMLTLLIGNAQIMRREYLQGKDTLKELVVVQPGWAFAWHNLGVAEFNAAWGNDDYDGALTAFGKARTIDPNFDLSLVSLAQVHRTILHDDPAEYEAAQRTCTAAKNSSNVSIQAQSNVCDMWNQIYGKDADPTAILPVIADDTQFRQMVTVFWAEPLAILGIVQEFYWNTSQDKAAERQMYQYYDQYLIAAYDDVLLEEARQTYQTILNTK